MSIWSDKPLIDKWISEACISNEVPDLIPKIKWRFNRRFRSRIADADWGTMTLRFSVLLWGKAPLEEKENTTKHEACHIIAHVKFGKVKSHGPEWKSTMFKAGQEPTRCHNIKLSQKTIDVVCTGCKIIIPIGSIRFRRMKNGKRYNCKKCGSKVEFIPVVINETK